MAESKSNNMQELDPERDPELEEMMDFFVFAHNPASPYRGTVTFKVKFPNGGVAIRSVRVGNDGVKIFRGLPPDGRVSTTASMDRNIFFDVYMCRIPARSAVLSGQVSVQGWAFRELYNFASCFVYDSANWKAFYEYKAKQPKTIPQYVKQEVQSGAEWLLWSILSSPSLNIHAKELDVTRSSSLQLDPSVVLSQSNLQRAYQLKTSSGPIAALLAPLPTTATNDELFTLTGSNALVQHQIARTNLPIWYRLFRQQMDLVTSAVSEEAKKQAKRTRNRLHRTIGATFNDFMVSPIDPEHYMSSPPSSPPRSSESHVPRAVTHWPPSSSSLGSHKAELLDEHVALANTGAAASTRTTLALPRISPDFSDMISHPGFAPTESVVLKRVMQRPESSPASSSALSTANTIASAAHNRSRIAKLFPDLSPNTGRYMLKMRSPSASRAGLTPNSAASSQGSTRSPSRSHPPPHHPARPSSFYRLASPATGVVPPRSTFNHTPSVDSLRPFVNGQPILHEPLSDGYETPAGVKHDHLLKLRKVSSWFKKRVVEAREKSHHE